MYVYIFLGKAVFKRSLLPIIFLWPSGLKGISFQKKPYVPFNPHRAFLRCSNCSHAGLAPGCPTHERSERYHRCTFSEPVCT